MLTDNDKSAVAVIERWFKKQCNGNWEHNLGIIIETTDNPGWILTFKELKIAKEELSDVIGDLFRQYDSQIQTDGGTLRVFAPSLQQVLISAAILAERSK